MSKNPNITYRFGVGDTVAWHNLSGELIRSKVTSLCFCDESYNMDNGWICPGYSLVLVERGVAEFPEIWTTRDGRKIAVQDMDEHHVRAALNMVIRRSRRRLALLKLQAEIKTILTMPREMRDIMEKHELGFDDLWPDRDKEFS